MATTDIVARLQLRAEQFSSETGQRFAELKTRARSAAQDIRSDFVGAFSEVQKIAQTALVLPRNATGSLDLSSEVAQLRTSAAAAEQKAQALREMSIALAAASNAANVDTQAMRLEADASAVASLAEERNAQAIRERIIALEAVQNELNQTTSATRVLTRAEEEQLVASRRSGSNFTMLGQQLQDFAVQVGSGQSAMTAFIQQLPQATYALSTMGGAAGKVGVALTGGVGTAATIALIALGPFVAKLFEAAEAAKAAEVATINLGSVENDLAAIFGKTSSKIAEQNELLLINARIKAANLRIEAAQNRKDSAQVFQRAGQSSYVPGTEIFAALGLTGGNREVQGLSNRAAAAANLRQKIGESDNAFTARQGALFDQVIKDAQITDFKGSGFTQSEFLEGVSKAVSARANNVIADLIDESLTSGKIVDALKKPEKTKKAPKPKDFTRQDDASEEMIARINAEWDEQPKLVDRARIETLKLDNLIERLQKRKLTPEVQKLIGLANDAKQAIQNGLDRPFRDFVERERESLAIGRLVLEGRDAEADAMRNALQIQERQGYISTGQLQTVLQLAEEHERITRALEDQRRVIGIYQNAWSGLTDEADRFFAKLQGSTGGALGVIQKLQRDLLTNAIFGGVERDIEVYIRKMTGKQTPAEILADQAKGAGVALRDSVNESSDALADFVKAVRSASGAIGGGSDLTTGAAARAGSIGGAIGAIVNSGAANDNGIVVTGHRSEAESLLRASGVLGVAIDGFAANLHRLGIDVPKSVVEALKKGLPTVFEGAAFGQLGGSVFAKITGGKSDKTGSAIGGVLGEVAGKTLGPAIAKTIGGALGKTIGGAAGPIGAVVGGILGNLVGGLFHQSTYGTAILSSATSPVNATGRGSGSLQAANGLGGSVQQGLAQLADQLGATLGAFDTVVGVFDGKYRVRTTASGWDGNGPLDYKGNSGRNLYDFGEDEQAAIAFAIADAVKDGALKGLSAASSAILASGQDLTAAVNKVMLIEAIPKDLKAMLDPVGAAVDDLNRKWQRTVNALKEGGASAEQMAQAQQLYDLQLQQVKNSTAAASQGLKDFLTSIKLGGNSPYSLRDQEATALAQLKPFLDQINLGQAVDQEKYQAAANAAIDVERQIYGSTKGFFDFLDTIQAATTKAISTIDNAAPITAPVESPFAKATATNTATANDLLAQLSRQAEVTNDLLAQLGADSGGGGFIGSDRLFKKTG